MNPRSLYRLAGTAVVTTVAGIALATPPAAMVDPAPPPNPDGVGLSGGGTSSDDGPWLEIGIAAVGGLALAGAGIAASSAARRRSLAHTA